MPEQILQVAWSPAQYHDVFARAATFLASLPASEVERDESGLEIR